MKQHESLFLFFVMKNGARLFCFLDGVAHFKVTSQNQVIAVATIVKINHNKLIGHDYIRTERKERWTTF
ncbi:hypothetical protein CHI14_23835 [Paenibacillus sp. 7516]|nr:hypothetical protein CHI14_23835 [Paenibacillus sp. 7516]